MPPPTISPASPNSTGDELRALDVMIGHQKGNIWLNCAASLFLFLLACGLLFFFIRHNAIREIGPALGNLLTFISGFFPVSGVIAANSRIGELQAARLLAGKLVMTANEQELLRELLKK